MIKHKMPSQTSILFNGAALLVVAASAVVLVRTTFMSRDAPVCAERYPNATRFSLDRDGQPMSADEIQSYAANSDWGLLSGAEVVKLKSGPAPFALQLDLATAPHSGTVVGDKEQVGIGFDWAPRDLGQPAGACLSYGAFFPEGFTFGKSGRLPGITGTAPPSEEEASAPPGFIAHVTWTADGAAGVLTRAPTAQKGIAINDDKRGFRFPLGRWVRLDQELVLNTPGRGDGVIRIWADGSLILERTNVMVRAQPTVQLSGMVVQAVAGEPVAGTKTGPQKIWLTPFELRWR